MIINKEFLKSLGPCKDRWTNYLKHYSNWSGTPLKFTELDLISSEDKLWVILMDDIIPSKELHLLACDFAESVLHVYETAYPQDFRPRRAIEAKRKWVKGEVTLEGLGAASGASRAASGAAERERQLGRIKEVLKTLEQTTITSST